MSWCSEGAAKVKGNALLLSANHTAAVETFVLYVIYVLSIIFFFVVWNQNNLSTRFSALYYVCKIDAIN